MSVLKKLFSSIIIIILIISTILFGIWIGFKYTNKEDKFYSLLNNFYSFLPFNSFKKTILTSENYDEINKKISDELSEEELCYFTYSCIYYITQDGLSNSLLTEPDESIIYQRIYNKSIQQLINEGKTLMKENNIKWQEYLKTLQDFGNAVNEFNVENNNLNQE